MKEIGLVLQVNTRTAAVDASFRELTHSAQAPSGPFIVMGKTASCASALSISDEIWSSNNWSSPNSHSADKANSPVSSWADRSFSSDVESIS